MALTEIIQKSVVVDTPRAEDLAARPEEWANRFQFHVSTHVAIADLTDRWDAILKNLMRGRSATGLIHADTGYGKTSTATALWHYAEQREIVAVPPFVWNSIADMLTATHGWVCHRLKAKRPDLIPDLEQQYERLIASSDEDRARRISDERDVPPDHAIKIVQALKARGDLMDAVSANRLIDYLQMATSKLLEAEYKGLLILPDEFEIFANTNPDIAKNFAELKDLIFPIFQENNLPIGCVVLTYRRTFSEIELREPYIFARFNKPEGSLINLEQAYGKIENDKSFADELWEKLSIRCNLTDEERNAIDPDVLFALGQFLGHQRTTQLISGPRSVVATFRRAAIHYGEKKRPYSIFDFCKDYISQGIICFNNQEIDTVKAHTSIMSQPIIGADEARQRAVKLLCVCPDGVPEALFKKHGISAEDRLAVVQGLLGTHVITKIKGPTLPHYKDDLQAGDALIEILKILRERYNPASEETHRAAVRSFANYILPEIFQQHFKSYRAVAISHQWQKNLGMYTQALRNNEGLGIRQGKEPLKRIGREVPALFAVGQHTTFANTFYPNGVLRDLLLVNEIDASGKTTKEGIEVKNNRSSVAVYFKLHSVEQRVLEMLEASAESIVVDGKSAKAMKIFEVFQWGEGLGYLNDEIEELINVLKARGLVNQKQQRGMDYLYRVETEINLTELQRKFDRLEALEALATQKGFALESDGDNSLASVQADFQIIGIASNEILKDALRQKLNSIEGTFQTQCAGWLKTVLEQLNRKTAEVGTLGLDPPNVLKQETEHPTTEFSVLLFQDIRNEIRKAYSAIPREMDKVKQQVRAILEKKIREYGADQTFEKAIAVAAELRHSAQTIDKKIDALREKRSEAELLYGLYEKWRNLARQVEHNRLAMTDAREIDGVKNLCDRLDDEQQRIKRHLADRTKTVKQVLENHEYFSNRIDAVKTEFDQISERRKDEFIQFQAGIESHLR